MTPGQVDDPAGWRLLLGTVFFALLWLPVRFFVGREWLSAGWHKVTDPEWTQGGAAQQGYWQRAVTIPEQGRSPITYDWFRQLLQNMLDHGWYTWFAKLVAWGEVLVGLGVLLILAWKVAGYWGLDRWLLPALGTPWQRTESMARGREAIPGPPPAGLSPRGA